MPVPASFPVKKVLRGLALKFLKDESYVDKHFTPSYDPWDQRLCVVPNADLFKALRGGGASIVTDTIETFDETGIRLTSGEHLEADVIVTATGLKLKPFGGFAMTVDGAEVKLHDTMAYKALMLSEEFITTGKETSEVAQQYKPWAASWWHSNQSTFMKTKNTLLRVVVLPWILASS